MPTHTDVRLNVDCVCN